MSDPAKAAEPGAPEAAEGKAAPAPEYYEQLLRLKAEFENFRRRTDRERPEWLRAGRAEVVSKLLPLFDLLTRAHQEVLAGHADTPLAKGLDAIFREFDKIFKEEGVAAVDPAGRPFDPHFHEALGFSDAPGVEEGAVAETLQVGYLLGDKVLRAAKVRLQRKEAKS